MTWKFCSVFGCDNSEKKKIACVQGCKKSHSKEKCTHEGKYPELQNVLFFSFPKEAELWRKWFHFLRRKDIKSVSQITSNHMICSFHFQGGVGYCKAYPVPTIYNDPAIALRFNTNTTRHKAPRSRSLGWSETEVLRNSLKSDQHHHEQWARSIFTFGTSGSRKWRRARRSRLSCPWSCLSCKARS